MGFCSGLTQTFQNNYAYHYWDRPAVMKVSKNRRVMVPAQVKRRGTSKEWLNYMVPGAIGHIT